ncbi:MAG: phosphatase PAP2 family protein [bacterium]
MDKLQKREKRNWFLFMIGYFTAGYLAINWFTQGRSGFFDLGFPFEQDIPFVPIFIFGYILVYVSVLLVYLIFDDWDDWRRAIITFLGATTLAYLFFIFLPVRMSLRPDLTGLTGIGASVSRFYYFIDLPYNCFPSLHVTYPSLATLVSWRHHRIMRWVFAAMTLIVALSVVLVKQHYIADVAGGFLNASLIYWLTVRSESWFSCCRGARNMVNSAPAK